MKEFLKAAGIRALRTVAQAALAMIPAGIMITEVNWLTVLYTAALAGVCSLLTSIVTGLPEVEQKPPNQTLADQAQENKEGHVTVYAYEDYYEGNPVGEPLHEHDES